MDEREKDVSVGAVSRREFLKIAGVAGAAVGLGAGLGGLVAACGEEERPQPRARPPPPPRHLPRPARPPPRPQRVSRRRQRDQDRLRRASHGRPRQFRRGRQVLSGALGRVCRRWAGLRRRQETPHQVQHSGQPVRHQPGVAGGRRPHPEREDRHNDGGLHAGDGQPGCRPVRGQQHPLL